MAHDFGIMNKRTRRTEWFFGYANALMYRAFGEEQHNAGCSGDGAEVIKTFQETKEALDKAIAEFDQMGYPDPTRLDEIKAFRKAMNEDEPTDLYVVGFQ